MRSRPNENHEGGRAYICRITTDVNGRTMTLSYNYSRTSSADIATWYEIGKLASKQNKSYRETFTMVYPSRHDQEQGKAMQWLTQMFYGIFRKVTQ